MLRSGVRVVRGVAGKGLFDPGLLGTIDGASIAAAHLVKRVKAMGQKDAKPFNWGAKASIFW